MSYHFTKCVEAQAAFEGAEELFVKFLASLISTIIDPFKSLSYSKFNISKNEVSQLHLLFDAIADLFQFHIDSHDKLASPQTPTKSNSNSSSNLTSPPPNSYKNFKNNAYKHVHHRNTHVSTNTQFQQNLNSLIFKYYANLPAMYSKYFDRAILSLPHLSHIITTRTGTHIKKWFRTKCDNITDLHDSSTSYKSFAHILRDILTHGKQQADKLHEIAKSKYLTNSTEANTFEENNRMYLENIFINKWEEHRQKFDLLHMECTLTQSNIQLYHQDRRLMLTFSVDLPTSKRSTKNLFGLNKNKVAQQTQEGIFYIFNDMVLICTKDAKYKGCYHLIDEENVFINVNQDKKIITFDTDINDKKKVTVYMRKSEELRVALDAITEYQNNLRQRKWSDVHIKKSPPIPISSAHKSNSFPSSHPSIYYTTPPSLNQLVANTKYNRGRGSGSGSGSGNKQRASMNSGTTFSILTENTTFNDLSEPRTSNAYNTPLSSLVISNQSNTTLSSDKSMFIMQEIHDDPHEEEEAHLHVHAKPVENYVHAQEKQDSPPPPPPPPQISDDELESDDEENIAQKHAKFKLYRTESLKNGRRFSVPSILSSIASSGKGSNGGTNTSDSNNEKMAPKEPSPNYRGINSLDPNVSDSDEHKSGHKLRKRSKSLLSKQVRFKSNNSFNDDDNAEITINIALKEGNEYSHLDDDIPIYEEEDILGKDQMSNPLEEQYLIEENAEKLQERADMTQIDLREDTPDSEQPVDDPHGLADVQFSDEEYTSEDDHAFKMKVLLKPNWAVQDEAEAGDIREYPRLSSKEYYAAHREILDNVKYSQNMHVHKLQLKQQLQARFEHKKKEIMDDEQIKNSMKMKIIQQMEDCVNTEEEKKQKIAPHPFERYLDEMHEYEQNGEQQILHDRYRSQELYVWDDNDEEIDDEETNNFLDIESKSKSKSKSKSGLVLKLKLKLNLSSNTSKGSMASTLGPSASVGLNDDDDVAVRGGDTLVAIDNPADAEGIEYVIASPTENVLERFNLQNDKLLLLAEIQRLRNIIMVQKHDMDGMENEVEQLHESVVDKEEQTKALRSTNVSLKRQNNELTDKIKQEMDSNAELKLDNERLNGLVRMRDDDDDDDHDEYDFVYDDDSQKSWSMVPRFPSQPLTDIPSQPLMKSSKSDISLVSFKNLIAPELVHHSNSSGNMHGEGNKKKKFDDYTQMTQLKKSNTNTNFKKKNKTFQRPKYHSFALGQAKKERMHRLRNQKQKSHNNEVEVASPAQSQPVDHLNSVKNALIGLKLQGLVPQSMTQITPQHSCRGTPKIPQKLSEKSLVSAASSVSFDEAANGLRILSMIDPVSIPIYSLNNDNSINHNVFGSPVGSPSPIQTSPLPLTAPRMLPIKGKSYDNIQIHKQRKFPSSPGPIHSMSPTTSNHKRTDTPTPIKKLKSNKFLNYTKIGQSEGMLLKKSDSSTLKLEQIPSVSPAVTPLSNNNQNKKRISFANHHGMHYVEDDDDNSDMSIGNLVNKKVARLPKRRITYTKSANTVYPQRSNNNNEENTAHSPVKKYKSKPTFTTNRQNTQIPSYFSRGHSQSFSAQNSRKHRSGSISTKSSYSINRTLLKDRTGKNRKTNSNSNSFPTKNSLYPKTPQVNKSSHVIYKRENQRYVPQKRRSVNFTPSQHTHFSLKPKPSQRTNRFMTPNFVPKSSPATYPNTFSNFTLNDR